MATISISSNPFALKVQRRLDESGIQLSKSLQRLSSGARINSASDDAAGLAVAAQLTADSRIFTQSVKNINDSISGLNIAEGAVSALSTILTRQRELATQAASGSFSAVQRRALDAEANELVKEYNRIAGSSTFNGISLLAPNFDSLQVQFGKGTNNSLGVAVGNQLERSVFSGGMGTTSNNTATGIFVSQKAADVNGDGKPDILLVDSVGGALNVFMGNGDGTFAAVRSYTAMTNTLDLTISDFNGDGKADVAMVNTSTGAAGIQLGNGDGSFRTIVTYATNDTRKSKVCAGDFDGDGYQDLVVGGGSSKSTGETMDVLYGVGNGTFQSAVTISATETYRLRACDVDGDGRSELMRITGSSGGFFELYRCSANRVWQRTINDTSELSYNIEAADANADGYDDMFVERLSRIDAYIGNGDGTFRAAATYSGSSTTPLAGVVDLTGDGYLDVVTIDTIGDTVTYAAGNGDGTFAASVSTPVGFDTSTAFSALVDVNNDGLPDYFDTDVTTSRVTLAGAVRSVNMQYFSLRSQKHARRALDLIDTATQRVNNELSALGVGQSRLQTAMATIGASRTNTEAALGRIVDADVADESAKVVAAQIRQATAAQIMKSVSTQPEIVLKLLKP